MTLITNGSSILTIALIAGISLIPACSAEKSNVNSIEAASGTAQNPANESTQKNTGESQKPMEASQTEALPVFKKGDDYKTKVREKLLRAGWKPARSEEGADNCEGGGSFCEEYPELDGGPAAGQGKAIFRWERGGKFLRIYTSDDPPLYSEQEFEKAVKESDETGLAGKYELAEIGISGDHSLELKSDHTAKLQVLQEDGTLTGTGSWKWEQAKNLVSVSLSVKIEIAGDDPDKKPEVVKVLFQFERAGRNLKIVNQTLAPDVSYSGKLFKKI